MRESEKERINKVEQRERVRVRGKKNERKKRRECDKGIRRERESETDVACF